MKNTRGVDYIVQKAGSVDKAKEEKLLCRTGKTVAPAFNRGCKPFYNPLIYSRDGYLLFILQHCKRYYTLNDLVDTIID